MNAVVAEGRTTPGFEALSDGFPADGASLLADAGKALARFPFDALREHHAGAVRAGIVERSLIASARFERKLGALERSVLGPWARSR